MTATSTRQHANLRYYCDNDPMDEAGGTRWTLRPDPPPSQRPRYYLTQRRRVRNSIIAALGDEPFQEWQDLANGINMLAKTPGCNNEIVFQYVLSYIVPIVSPLDNMNVCDRQLAGQLHSFGDILEGRNLHSGVSVEDMNFESMTAVAIFREFCFTFNPNYYSLAYGLDERIIGWRDVLDVATTERTLSEPSSVIWYAIIAMLSTRGFYLDLSNARSRYDGEVFWALNWQTD
ncbi:MAG: hypothetical protein Q9227_009121 [Pyrenula ochraceoflavens]